MDPSRFKDPSHFKSHTQPQMPSSQPALNTQATPIPSTNPPAYTPRATNPTPLAGLGASMVTSNDIDHEAECDDEEACPSTPPISLTITAPLKIVGNGNFISTEIASNCIQGLTTSVMTALQQSSVALDEEGRSRPIYLSIMGGVSVCGSRNVVGKAMPVPVPVNVQTTEGVASEKSKAASAAAAGLSAFRSAGVAAGKKRRAESEPPESNSAKRVHRLDT